MPPKTSPGLLRRLFNRSTASQTSQSEPTQSQHFRDTSHHFGDELEALFHKEIAKFMAEFDRTSGSPDLAAQIKQIVIDFIENHEPLHPLGPIREILKVSQQPDHGLDRRAIVKALLQLIQTDNWLMKHWIQVPKQIQDFGEALLNDKPLPDLGERLPATAEYHEAQVVLQKRFELQDKSTGPNDPVITESDGTRMRFIKDLPFANWGGTVKNIPSYTFTARSVKGIQNLVLWAKSQNLKVRAAGYTHTWTNLYSESGQVLVSLLPLANVREFPSKEPDLSPAYKEVQFIEVVKEMGDSALVKVGAGTTNEQFREWSFKNKKWSMPMNVLMVEITFGGSNAPICHGAGLKYSTLSDLVVSLDYVDANGILQTIDDPAELKTASGCFGLLGIVVSMTLKIEKMSVASMKPEKPRLALTIPPPKGFKIPHGVDMSGITEQDVEAAQAKFEAQCQMDYAEFFWFPYNRRGWINCWNQDEEGSLVGLQTFPHPVEAFIQWIGAYIIRLLVTYSPFQLLPGKAQGWLLGWLAMFQLEGASPPQMQPAISALKSDAIHFQRGAQNFAPVLDCEWNIPIPFKVDGKSLDFSIIQKAWWDAIAITYAAPDGPLRMTLELRITGGSGVTMSPQAGNAGTCSIEILTLANIDKATWQPYSQQVVDAWTSYKDPITKKNLNSRPHFAKGWEGYMVQGVDVMTYLKEVAYRDEIVEFRNGLEAITTKRHSSLAETRARFGNPLLENLFFT